MLVHFLLNVSMVFSLLAAPAFLFFASRYKKSLGSPRFEWHRSELVVFTISFFTAVLLLSIVGITCIFQVLGHLDGIHISYVTEASLFLYSLICFNLIVGLIATYFAIRKIMVQVVVEEGIVFSNFRVPVFFQTRLVDWDQIVDYYVVPDYPNAQFTFVIQNEGLQFSRQTLRVPIYLKDDFQAFLNDNMAGCESFDLDEEISSHNFLEN